MPGCSVKQKQNQKKEKNLLFCFLKNVFGINSNVVYYLCRLWTTKLLLNKSSQDSTAVPEAAGEALAIENEVMVLHGRHSPACSCWERFMALLPPPALGGWFSLWPRATAQTCPMPWHNLAKMSPDFWGWMAFVPLLVLGCTWHSYL